MHEFIWKDKPTRIRNKVIKNSKENGGGDMVDVELKDICLKLNWLIRLVKTPGLWCEYVYENVIPTGILDIGYFMECNLLWKDYPVKIKNGSIWYNIMKYWCTINFVSASVVVRKGHILDTNIWYNSDIRIKKKPNLLANLV